MTTRLYFTSFTSMKIDSGILFDYSKCTVGIFTATSYKYGQKHPDATFKITPWQTKEHPVDFKVDIMDGDYELADGLKQEDLQLMEQAIRKRLSHDMIRGKNYKYVYNFLSETANSYTPGHRYDLVMWTDKTDDDFTFWFVPTRSVSRASIDPMVPMDEPYSPL